MEDDYESAFNVFQEYDEETGHRFPLPLSNQVTQQSSSSITPSGLVPRRASYLLKRKLTPPAVCKRSAMGGAATRERHEKRNADIDFEINLDNYADDGEDSEDSEEEDEDLLFDSNVIKQLKQARENRWSTEAPAILKKRLKADIFKKTAGPQGEAKKVKTELAAFKLFFDEEMFDMIVESTNREIQKHRPSASLTFADTCKDEIKCLFGVMLFRGVNHDIKNRTDDLWYGNEVSRNLYRASMTRNRFQFLL